MSRALTIDELAARVPLPKGCAGGHRYIARLLAEEIERGNVIVADGGFALSHPRTPTTATTSATSPSVSRSTGR